MFSKSYLYVTRVYICCRYKLHVKVINNSGVSKCMLFDSKAAEIIMQSAFQVLNGSFDEVCNLYVLF